MFKDARGPFRHDAHRRRRTFFSKITKRSWRSLFLSEREGRGGKAGVDAAERGVDRASRYFSHHQDSKGSVSPECLVLLYDDLTRPSAAKPPPVFSSRKKSSSSSSSSRGPGRRTLFAFPRVRVLLLPPSRTSLILLFGKERRTLSVCACFSRVKSSLLRGTFTVYKQLLSSFCVCILYYVYVYITEKRNKTSSRELLLLLKSDPRAQQNGVFTRELSRDEI